MMIKQALKRTILFTFMALLFSSFSFSAEIGPERNIFIPQKIRIEGLKKIEREAVLTQISIRAGQMLTNKILHQDILSIYQMKFFETVSAFRDRNNVLTFRVVEKPTISSINFSGNDEVSDDDLTEVIKSKSFDILDVNQLKKDLSELRKHYEEKGFYLAQVNLVQKERPDGQIDVVFEIKEFDKVQIKKITFLGNKAFDDYKLKSLMETKEQSVLSFLSGAGNFKEFNFQTDIERLKYFYKTQGHLQVNLGAPEITISEDRKWIFITVKINEGPRFEVNSVSFRNQTEFDDEELLPKIKMNTGSTYSEDKLRIDIQKLTELYQDEGYAFANVLRTLNIVPGENKVDVVFSFEKGKIVNFGRVSISGNMKTRDKVIRRELTFEEGTKFSGSKLRTSRENVTRLGFFEPGSVIFNTVSRPGEDDVIDIEVSVKERNTGQISLGAGYSTATGGFLQGSVSQNNFLGKGQNLTLSLSLSSVNKTYNLGFTDPYFLDTLWTAGGDLYSQNNNASTSLAYKRRGFDLRIGYPIFTYTRLFGTYKYEDTSINDVNDPTIDISLENGLASIIRASIIHDKRNNSFEPSKGFYFSGSTEFSGLGGVKKWFKWETDARYFKKVAGDLVLRSRLYVSKISEVGGQPIPRTEKLTLGGSRNLRGYSFEGIGPLIEVEEDGQTVTYNRGGKFAAFSTIELEHPLAREAGLKWVVFFDVGDAGEFENFRANMDYGFGFRWFSPIGILRFEFGYPINPKDPNAGSQFHFDIGQLF